MLDDESLVTQGHHSAVFFLGYSNDGGKRMEVEKRDTLLPRSEDHAAEAGVSQTTAGQKPQDLGITTYESICHEINASPPATPSIYPLHTHRSLCRAIPIPQRRPEETQPQHQP
jgi:hypothetical protein